MHKAKNQLLTINHVVLGYANRENEPSILPIDRFSDMG
jgi:hypothetical protein